MRNAKPKEKPKKPIAAEKNTERKELRKDQCKYVVTRLLGFTPRHTHPSESASSYLPASPDAQPNAASPVRKHPEFACSRQRRQVLSVVR